MGLEECWTGVKAIGFQALRPKGRSHPWMHVEVGHSPIVPYLHHVPLSPPESHLASHMHKCMRLRLVLAQVQFSADKSRAEHCEAALPPPMTLSAPHDLVSVAYTRSLSSGEEAVEPLSWPVVSECT